MRALLKLDLRFSGFRLFVISLSYDKDDESKSMREGAASLFTKERRSFGDVLVGDLAIREEYYVL